MAIEKGFIRVEDVEASAQVPPEGSLVYARDTDLLFKSDGTTLTEVGAGGASYTNEEAQDAVGAMVDTSLVYVDGTPLLSRAALTGDVTAAQGSNATTIANDAVTDAKLRESAGLSVIGRSANSTGNPADIVGATPGHILQVFSGPSVGFGAPSYFSSSLPCWDNPPDSPSAYDDEFTATSLDAKWTISSTGTTNAATTGTIDYTASLTTPIIDAATVPSCLMFQSDDSSLGQIRITQSFTQATNETHFFKVLANQRNVSTNGEGAFYIELWNSSDANEFISVGTTNSGSIHDVWASVTNDGATVGTASGSISEGSKGMPTYIVIWKNADVYYFGIAGADKGSFNVFTSKTKTGVTTFDRITLMLLTANETPSIIDGVDFYRYKDSLDYSLVNTDSGAGGLFTTEDAQDAVGLMIDTTLEYTDGTPLLSRAALTGDVTAAAGSNSTTIANDSVTFAKMQNVSGNILLGKDFGGPGDVEEITMGTHMDLQFGSLVCTIENRKIVGVTFDGNGSPPTVGSIGYIVAPFNADIENWYITSDVSGSAVVDVWKVNAAIPTNANSISTVDKPTLSSQQINSDGTLVGWSDTTCSYGDVFGFELESVTTCTRVTVQLTYIEQ